jgi:hypothetical protein
MLLDRQGREWEHLTHRVLRHLSGRRHFITGRKFADSTRVVILSDLSVSIWHTFLLTLSLSDVLPSPTKGKSDVKEKAGKNNTTYNGIPSMFLHFPSFYFFKLSATFPKSMNTLINSKQQWNVF